MKNQKKLLTYYIVKKIYFINRIALLFGFLFYSTFGFTQSYKFKLIDEDGEGIPLVKIKDVNGNYVTSSNYYGYFFLNDLPKIITTQHNFYIDTSLLINKNDTLLELKSKYNQLNETVINTSFNLEEELAVIFEKIFRKSFYNKEFNINTYKKIYLTADIKDTTDENYIYINPFGTGNKKDIKGKYHILFIEALAEASFNKNSITENIQISTGSTFNDVYNVTSNGLDQSFLLEYPNFNKYAPVNPLLKRNMKYYNYNIIEFDSITGYSKIFIVPKTELALNFFEGEIEINLEKAILKTIKGRISNISFNDIVNINQSIEIKDGFHVPEYHEYEIKIVQKSLGEVYPNFFTV